MKILITGSRGFLGGALLAKLKQYSHYSLFGFSSSFAGEFQGVRVAQVDLLDAGATQQIISVVRPDVVIHAAALMAGTERANRTHDYFENVIITRNLVNALLKNPPKQFCYVSSLDVYGNMPGKYHLSQQTLLSPTTPYGLSKQVGESFAQFLGKKTETQVSILRCTQLYGPSDPGRKFIPTCVYKIKQNQVMSIFGDGTDLRDYLYVEDAACIIEKIVAQSKTGEWIIASGQSVSLNDVLSTFKELEPSFSWNYEESKKPLRHNYCDVSSLRDAIGTMELTDLKEGLTRILASVSTKGAAL